jgi:hypothetical protein
MFVGCRLPDLSALEAHYAGLVALTQSSGRSASIRMDSFAGIDAVVREPFRRGEDMSDTVIRPASESVSPGCTLQAATAVWLERGLG